VGDLKHRVLVRAAQVHDLACQAVRLHHRQEAADEVVDVTQRPGLGAVAVDRERAVLQRLDAEVRDQTTVLAIGAGTVRVEDPRDPSVHAVHPNVAHDEALAEALRLVVAGPRANRIDIAPVRLRLGMDERIAVHLGRRREQEP